jgi:hypothetical protein
MTSRTLGVLAAALVLLALLAVYGQRSGDPQTRGGDLLVPGLQAALGEIDRVRIVGAGSEPLATLTLSSGRWIVEERRGYPADIAKIRAALRGLAEARIVEEKTANPAYYDRLGVQGVDSPTASGVEIIVLTDDAPRAAVIVGDQAGSGSHYVRVSDQAVSLMVDTELDVPRDAVGWIDPAIIDIPSARISAVTIRHPEGETVHIFKESSQQSDFTVDAVPEGRELSYPGVANVLANTLRDLRLDDVEPAPAEEAAEPIRATFRTFDGLVVTAEVIEREDGAWVRFDAGADAAAGAGAQTGSDASASAGAQTSDDFAAAPADAEVVQEAERINARVAGWQYRVPSYQLGQLTRRLEDLLRAEGSE